VVGTADYMSPEQVKGDKVDARSDLFSVGCMLYELITGRRPFHSDNLMAIFYKITHDGPNLDLVPAGPEHDALLPILTKALGKGLDERYQTAYDFAVDLREWLKTHATTDSSQHVLESLVDLEAPTHMPQPMTDASGATVVPLEARELGGATVDLGRRPPARPAPAGRGARPSEGRGPATRPPRRARRVQERASSPAPWIALVVVLGAAGAGGYFYWKGQQPGPPPATTLATAPPPTQAAPPTTLAPAPPPVTAAPQPQFDEAAGKAAASVKAAQAAFRKGDYDRAVSAAQQALREDGQNKQAQDVLSRALDGQKAAARVQAGEAALRAGDFDGAEREAQAALGIASWDKAAADLRTRVDAARLKAQHDAEAQAEQQRTARINTLLNDATNALAAKKYAAAITAYDAVLALDAGNVAAQTGKSNAITARAVAEATAGGGGTGPAPGHSFAQGTTVASGGQAASAGPAGFDSNPEVEVHRGSQAAALPGKLMLEATPAALQPGDRYSISAYLLNEGGQPIELERLVVTTITNGNKQGPAPVRPLASVVAPRAKTLVFQTPRDVWKESTTSWSMEIVVWTTKRETYTNTLTWK